MFLLSVRPLPADGRPFPHGWDFPHESDNQPPPVPLSLKALPCRGNAGIHRQAVEAGTNPQHVPGSGIVRPAVGIVIAAHDELAIAVRFCLADFHQFILVFRMRTSKISTGSRPSHGEGDVGSIDDVFPGRVVKIAVSYGQVLSCFFSTIKYTRNSGKEKISPCDFLSLIALFQPYRTKEGGGKARYCLSRKKEQPHTTSRNRARCLFSGPPV